MSDLMLLGILRMPLSMVEGDPLTLVQFVQCANGAADRIEHDARLIDQLRAELEAREALMIDMRDAMNNGLFWAEVPELRARYASLRRTPASEGEQK